MRFRLIFCVFSITLFSACSTSTAGLAPEFVLLVVNGDSPASVAVANEYAHLRGIPDLNIVTLTGVTNVEQLPVDEFRRQILGPSAGRNGAIELDATKLVDGEHQLTVLAAGNDAVETMGRWTTRFSVRNGDTDQQPQLVIRSQQEQSFDKPVEIESSCPGATEITIHHLGRIVATIAGDAGVATLDPKAIGSGTVTLRPVATLSDGKLVRGQPVVVMIVTP